MQKLGTMVASSLWALALVVGLYACTGNDFGGNSGRRFSSNSKGRTTSGEDGTGLKDSGDSDGDSDSGHDGNDGGSSINCRKKNKRDCKSGSSGGGDASDGGVDSNDGQADSGMDTSGDAADDADGSDSSGTDSGGLDQSDGAGTGGGGSDVLTDGGETSLKLTSDLTLNLIKENDKGECGDEKTQITIESYVAGQLTKTYNAPCPLMGHPHVIPGACYKTKDTCLKITFNYNNGKTIQDTWGNAKGCIFVEGMGPGSAKVGWDYNGAGFLGTCKAWEDDILQVSCGATKSLSLQNCN